MPSLVAFWVPRPHFYIHRGSADFARILIKNWFCKPTFLPNRRHPVPRTTTGACLFYFQLTVLLVVVVVCCCWLFFLALSYFYTTIYYFSHMLLFYIVIHLYQLFYYFRIAICFLSWYTCSVPLCPWGVGQACALWLMMEREVYYYRVDPTVVHVHSAELHSSGAPRMVTSLGFRCGPLSIGHRDWMSL